MKITNKKYFVPALIALCTITTTLIFNKLINKSEREPTYTFKKAPTLIFDSNNTSSKIQFYYNDIAVNSNVYVANIIIWNNGKLEIKREDIRNNLKFIEDENIKILEYEIVNQSHDGLGDFKLKREQNDLILDWKNFDPGFSLEVKIIYSAKDNKEILMDGYVKGNEMIKSNARKESSPLYILVIICLLVALIFTIFRMIKSKANLLNENKDLDLKSRSANFILNAYLFLAAILLIGFSYVLYNVF
ncbi:hypothetical protein [Dokdonia pacifica]|nr:hypothetical protein [Dokdonia pacifica]